VVVWFFSDHILFIFFCDINSVKRHTRRGSLSKEKKKRPEGPFNRGCRRIRLPTKKRSSAKRCRRSDVKTCFYGPEKGRKKRKYGKRRKPTELLTMKDKRIRGKKN